LICGANLLLLVSAALAIRVFSDSSGSSVKQERLSTDKSIQEYEAAITQLRGKLAQANEKLRISRAILNQPDWSKLLALLADELGHDIVLNHCGLAALNSDVTNAADNQQSGPAKVGTESPAGAIPVQRRYGLKLVGFGRSQGSVSQFVLRLERTGIFETVRLLNSYRQDFLGDQAITFSLDCRI
jgi:hypothetical protein